MMVWLCRLNGTVFLCRLNDLVWLCRMKMNAWDNELNLLKKG